MAMQKTEVNKSQAIRDVLSQNFKTPTNEVISTLAAKGINVSDGLVYIVKGKMRAKRRRQVKEKVATVVGTASNGDALSTIRKVKGLAVDVGGMKKLKA